MKAKRAPRGQVDLPEYLAMLHRMVRAAGARVADADVEDLAQLHAIRETLDLATLAAVRGVRESGATWEQIGAVTGVTRQAALMRWRPLLG